MCEEAEDSDTGDGGVNEGREVVVGNVEGPAPALETGMPKYEYEASFIDALIAFSRSSSSLESCPEYSLDSFSERVSASASCFSRASFSFPERSLDSFSERASASASCFARASFSLEACPERSLDSFSESASASANSFSSSTGTG